MPLPTRHAALSAIGGSFEGPRLRGEVLPDGGDWLLMRPDGVLEQDVRITLKTDNGAFIYLRYAGMRHGPPEVMARLAQGETVDPSEYYFRVAPGIRNWSRALRLAEQDLGCGCRREITAQHSSVLDFRDTVSDTVCEPTGDKVSAGSVCGNRRPRKLNALAT